MAVTLPQKYVEWMVTMLSATAVMAPCRHGLRPILHWRGAVPKPLKKLVLFHAVPPSCGRCEL